MRTAATKDMLRLATALKTPTAKAVAGAIEVGVVVPSVLEKKLTDAGYMIEKKALKVRHMVRIEEARKPTKNDPTESVMVAQGLSDTPADALLQAVYAWLVEQEKESKKAAK